MPLICSTFSSSQIEPPGCPLSNSQKFYVVESAWLGLAGWFVTAITYSESHLVSIMIWLHHQKSYLCLIKFDNHSSDWWLFVFSQTVWNFSLWKLALFSNCRLNWYFARSNAQEFCTAFSGERFTNGFQLGSFCKQRSNRDK